MRSHILRFSARARPRTMNRSIAIDKPEAMINRLGYMNKPQSWKNFTIVSNVLITYLRLQESLVVSKEHSIPPHPRACRVGSGRRFGPRGRVRQRVVVHLPSEHVAIDRGERLVEHALRRRPRQIAGGGLLP